MYRYNDKVIVVKDEENDGFYVGFEGLIKHYTGDKTLPGAIKQFMVNKHAQMYYGVCGYGETLYFKEDQLQKI